MIHLNPYLLNFAALFLVYQNPFQFDKRALTAFHACRSFKIYLSFFTPFNNQNAKKIIYVTALLIGLVAHKSVITCENEKKY
jgi:hypothetical protein